MATNESVIRAAIQALLNASETDHWQVSQFVLALGLERIDSEGRVESTPWVWAPPDQPEWATDGLLQAAITMRYDADIESD